MKHVTPPAGAPVQVPQDVAETLAAVAGQTTTTRPETSCSDAERLAAGRINLARLRKEAAAHIDRLIELLDQTEPDADLEPEVDCCPTEVGEEDLSDREPSLGWCEGMAQGQGRWGGTDDREEGIGARDPQLRTAIDYRPKIEIENSYRRFVHGLTDLQKGMVRQAQRKADGDPWAVVR